MNDPLDDLFTKEFSAPFIVVERERWEKLLMVLSNHRDEIAVLKKKLAREKEEKRLKVEQETAALRASRSDVFVDEAPDMTLDKFKALGRSKRKGKGKVN